MQDSGDGMIVANQDRLTIWKFNRPDADNGVDEATMAAMEAALSDLEAQAEQKSCLIIRGSETVFSTGLDAGMLEDCFKNRSKFSDVVLRMSEILERVVALPQVTIACVEGECRLGGLELALACDLFIAGKGARISDGHMAYDAMPGGGGTKRLPARLGYGGALLFLLEGPVLSGEDALKAGLVDDVAPDGEVITRCQTIAKSVTDRDIGLVQDIKTSLRAACPAPPDKTYLSAFRRSVIDRLVPE